MSRVEVCVVGSLNMDLVVRAPRLPGPGETVLGGPWLPLPGGKGANQAVAAARLGAETALVGCVGEDDFGRALLAGLEREGVRAEVDVTEERATGVALITVDEAGENTIVVDPGANGRLDGAHVRSCERTVREAEWLVCQLEIPHAAIAEAVRTARDGHTRFLLNAAPAIEVPPELLAAVDVLVVNAGEAARIAGRAGAPQSLAGELARRGPRTVIVTLGSGGALALEGGSTIVQAAFAVEARDAVGAGDAFVGGLVTELVRHAELAQALRAACAAGELATTRAGAQPSLPTRAEVAELLRRG